eukprot:scaffold875_cov185-Amphora_coffeaeformis.AAC.19
MALLALTVGSLFGDIFYQYPISRHSRMRASGFFDETDGALPLCLNFSGSILTPPSRNGMKDCRQEFSAAVDGRRTGH